ncbi:MAG: hypothetical protein ACM34K_16355 [Bacillota bacterium]
MIRDTPLGFYVFVDSLRLFASKQRLSGRIDKNIIAIDNLMKKQYDYFPMKENIEFNPPEIRRK